MGPRHSPGFPWRCLAGAVRDGPRGRVPCPDTAARTGMIKGWGLGVNLVERCELLLDLKEVKPDGFLLAGRYTLLDHERALQRVMPKAAGQDIDIVVGGPYSSGIRAGGAHFDYRQAPPEILARVERIKVIADRHNVAIKAAALQFSLAHPASAAIIPGASR